MVRELREQMQGEQVALKEIRPRLMIFVFNIGLTATGLSMIRSTEAATAN